MVGEVLRMQVVRRIKTHCPLYIASGTRYYIQALKNHFVILPLHLNHYPTERQKVFITTEKEFHGH